MCPWEQKSPGDMVAVSPSIPAVFSACLNHVEGPKHYRLHSFLDLSLGVSTDVEAGPLPFTPAIETAQRCFQNVGVGSLLSDFDFLLHFPSVFLVTHVY